MLCVLDVDLSLVVSLNGASGTNAQLSYGHTLTLHSPPTSFDVESCLELMFTAQSQFCVKLVCVTFSGTYNERSLYNSRQPLGLTLHKRKLDLPVTVSDYSNCSLALQMNTMTTGVVAVFSNIQVSPGQCSPPRECCLHCNISVSLTDRQKENCGCISNHSVYAYLIFFCTAFTAGSRFLSNRST